eukprot:UN32669
MARLEAFDVGKPFMEAMNSPYECQDVLNYNADAIKLISGKCYPGNNTLNITKKYPLGVIGVICPFNFPLEIAVSRIAPILACGCTCVLKPSEKTPINTLNLGHIFKEAGLPDGCLQILQGGGDVGQYLCEHKGI